MLSILCQMTNKWIHKHGQFPQENHQQALTRSVAWEVNQNGYINLFAKRVCPTPPLTTTTLPLPLSRRTALIHGVDEELRGPCLGGGGSRCHLRMRVNHRGPWARSTTEARSGVWGPLLLRLWGARIGVIPQQFRGRFLAPLPPTQLYCVCGRFCLPLFS